MSPYRIPYQAKGGARLDYVVPSFDEMTIDHYRKLAPIAKAFVEDETIDYRIGVVNEFAGIPVDVLNNLPMKEVQEVFDFMQDQCIKALQGSEEFNLAVSEERDYIPPETITIADKEYAVPYDLEMETVAGQWADWYAWEPPQHEADLIAETLAFMLVEKGTKYAGTPKGKVAAMGGANLAQSFDLCAFFFAKSERFRNATSQRKSSFHTLLNALVVKALKHLPSDTGASTSSLPPQN